MEKMALMTCLFLLSSPSKSLAACNEASAVSSHTDAGDKEELESTVSDQQSSAGVGAAGERSSVQIELLHRQRS